MATQTGTRPAACHWRDTAAADRALSAMLGDGRSRAALSSPDHTRLWNALEDASIGGKRFRPALVRAAHDTFDGTEHDAVAEVGAAIELLHTAFVIQDDVIDGDDIRRGRPNVSGTFRTWAREHGADEDAAAELAFTAGILAGDLAMATALRAIATCGVSPAVTNRLLDLFDTALQITTAGELADVRLSLGLEPASTDASLAMAEHKTSAYSFSLPLQAGALLAGAGPDIVQECDVVGRHLGVAFQLADDLLGVFGNPDLTRKSTTCDLRTRKQTPLLSHARSTDEWDEIDSHLGRDLGDAELAEVRRLLTRNGSLEFVTGLMRERLRLAQAHITALGLPTELPSIITDSLTLLLDDSEAA